ncbi:MAG: DUF885 domain-containing protein [Myxococcales bacterium FL481]|nr:MAG: DUF885 domain-containing protein [Myxococcales bacterium FL481]
MLQFARRPARVRFSASRIVLLAGALVAGQLLACVAGGPLTPAAVRDNPPAPTDSSEALHRLFAEAWASRLADDPLFASSVGDSRFAAQLADLSETATLRQMNDARGLLTRLDAIDVASLSRTDQISHHIFRRQLTDRLAEYEFGAHEMALTTGSGFHIEFAHMAPRTVIQTGRDGEDYADRLRAFPRYAAQATARLRRGVARGMVLPAVVLEGYDLTITAHIVDDPEASVFWQPLAELPERMPGEEQQRLRSLVRAAITEAVVPAYQTFAAFMRDEYRPGARASIGASELPDGDAYYAHLIRQFTTLELTAAEVHQIGLAEVRRILGEMHAVMQQVGFGGDLAAFLQHLRTDPRFYAETPEQLLREASYLAKRMDAALPRLFGHLPRLPYGVAPVPDHLAPKYTSGRYIDPAPGSGEPGYYWVNTYALESRPLYTLEALTLHEAVPGHHLQISLARELHDLPPFRRFLYLSAFGEGWALYAERLGLEAGFYADPYANFGRLTFEMWRACRLVVDTGIHAMHWSREQAVTYMAEHTALSLHDIHTEVDRYISWPGQALSYKMGELTIRRLRREAETALGAQFDIRRFHDVLLRNGAVPLPILEQEVQRYIADTASRSTPQPESPTSS